MVDCGSDNSGSIILEDNPAPSGQTLPGGRFEIAGATVTVNQDLTLNGALLVIDPWALLQVNGGNVAAAGNASSSIINYGLIQIDGGAVNPSLLNGEVVNGGITITGVTAGGNQSQAFTGIVATFQNSIAGSGNDSYTASIDWFGDGTEVTTGTVTSDGNGTFTVTGNLSAGNMTAGTFYPQITVIDSDYPNNLIQSTGYSELDVAGISVTGLDFNAQQGTAFNGNVAGFTDNAPDAGNFTAGNYSATIDWYGNGSVVTVGTITADATNGGYDVSGNYTYAVAGVYDISVTVTASDKREGTVDDLANVSSLVNVTGTSFNAEQGGNWSGAVATFGDVNSGTTATDYTASIDWGDGNDSDGTITGNDTVGYTVSGNDTFAMAGNLTVTVYITEPSGATATVTDTANVAGMAVSGLTITTQEGQQYIGNVATFTDTGTDADQTGDNYTANIDWGDGIGNTTGTVTVTGPDTFVISGNYTYASTGTFDPTVTITDSADGRVSSAQGEADVAAPPYVFIYGQPTAAAGSLYTLYLDADEFGSNTISNWMVNWGDGTADSPDLTAVAGNAASVQHVFASDVASATITAVAMDQSGTYPADGSVAVSVSSGQGDLQATRGIDAKLVNPCDDQPQPTITASVGNYDSSNWTFTASWSGADPTGGNWSGVTSVWLIGSDGGDDPYDINCMTPLDVPAVVGCGTTVSAGPSGGTVNATIYSLWVAPGGLGLPMPGETYTAQLVFTFAGNNPAESQPFAFTAPGSRWPAPQNLHIVPQGGDAYSVTVSYPSVTDGIFGNMTVFAVQPDGSALAESCSWTGSPGNLTGTFNDASATTQTQFFAAAYLTPLSDEAFGPGYGPYSNFTTAAPVMLRDQLSVTITNPGSNGFQIIADNSMPVTAQITDTLEQSTDGGITWYPYSGSGNITAPTYSVEWTANIGNLTDADSFTTTFAAPPCISGTSGSQQLILTATAIEETPWLINGARPSSQPATQPATTEQSGEVLGPVSIGLDNSNLNVQVGKKLEKAFLVHEDETKTVLLKLVDKNGNGVGGYKVDVDNWSGDAESKDIFSWDYTVTKGPNPTTIDTTNDEGIIGIDITGKQVGYSYLSIDVEKSDVTYHKARIQVDRKELK